MDGYRFDHNGKSMKETVISFISSAVFFAVFWGLAMWFWQWKKAHVKIPRAVTVSLISGLLYAVFQLLVKNMR